MPAKEGVASKKRVKFEIKAEPGCRISVAGDFNEWDATKNKLVEKKGGIYSTSIMLSKGRHEYKFVINDVWTVDPLCQDWVANSLGSLNSVINVE